MWTHLSTHLMISHGHCLWWHTASWYTLIIHLARFGTIISMLETTLVAPSALVTILRIKSTPYIGLQNRSNSAWASSRIHWTHRRPWTHSWMIHVRRHGLHWSHHIHIVVRWIPIMIIITIVYKMRLIGVRIETMHFVLLLIG